MQLVSKDRQTIINLNRADCVYIAADGRGVKASVSGAGYRMGTYQTPGGALIAVETIARELGKGSGVAYMPDDEAVTKELAARAGVEKQNGWHEACSEGRVMRIRKVIGRAQQGRVFS